MKFRKSLLIAAATENMSIPFISNIMQKDIIPVLTDEGYDDCKYFLASGDDLKYLYTEKAKVTIDGRGCEIKYFEIENDDSSYMRCKGD